MTRTLYRAPWIVAYKDGGHALLKNGCLVVEGDRITYVGRNAPDDVDHRVDVHAVISPGLISTHAHINESPVDKTIVEDANKRQFWSTSLIDILPPRAAAMSDADMEACVDLSIAEHLRHGATTVMQMGDVSGYAAEAVERSGIRAYVTGSYRSGRWLTADGRRVSYEWAEDEGFGALERAATEVRGIRARGNPRLRGWLNPAQVDTCTEGLLQESKRVADELDVPLTIHAAQSLSEFIEITRRYGRTPVEWLDDIGFLDERVILGHALFLTGTPWVKYAGEDLEIIARTGTSVAYNAWTFARNGINMHSYRRYLEAGVNVCLGTDSATQSMLDSLRWTAVLGKIAEWRADGATANQVFDSATIRAAQYLGREDLGRIAPGAQADLLFFRMDSSTMAPTRDPVKSIVYYAQPDDLTDVMVAGEWVIRHGDVQRIDVEQAARLVHRAGEKIWRAWPEHDWGNRSIDAHVPLSYPVM